MSTPEFLQLSLKLDGETKLAHAVDVAPATWFNESDAVWYCDEPLEKNTLDNFLGRMSEKAGLSNHFTLHCIRATSVTILEADGLENLRVRSLLATKVMAQSNHITKDRQFQQQVRSSAITSKFVAPVHGIVSSCCWPKQRSVLLQRYSKTVARTKFAASISSLMSALNKTNAAHNFSSGSFQASTFNSYWHFA